VENRHLVSMANTSLVMWNPPRPGEPLTVDEAVALAAWLVALADPAGEKFADALQAVQGS
jgi:hypothetical protein